MSVKLLVICNGARKIGNCHIVFDYYVLFFLCKIAIPVLLLVLEKLTFSSKLFHLSNSYTPSVTSNYSKRVRMMAKQKRAWVTQKRI